MLKRLAACRLNCPETKIYIQTNFKSTINSRNRKEYRKLRKQQQVAKDIELAVKDLKTAGKTVNFTEFPYEKYIKPGKKKDVSLPMPRLYSPHFVEAHWYNWWKSEGIFTPRSSSQSKMFSMVIPPPNITGKLHIGHALTCAIEDSLVRWQSMLGNDVLWVPGSDHAGIATQVVVERQLEQNYGETRSDLGREKFRSALWEWKNSKGDAIYRQLERLGASLNWDRSVFTLDDDYTYAVKEAFIRLFDEGIIYRDNCCINWCCHLQSTVSDVEVEPTMLEEPTLFNIPGYDFPVLFGKMHSFAYKLLNPSGDVDEVVVATTRLETMLGDEAVAVHPDDPRYSSLIGSLLVHPLRQNKFIPIIADTSVDMKFGTGAMKVTPAHDFLDFEIGKRHNLPIDSILDPAGMVVYEPDGKSSEDSAHNFPIGMPRYKVREYVMQQLGNFGLYRGSQPQQSVLRVCSRSGDVIEPMVKEQWFIRTEEMTQQAIDAFDDGRINFIQKSLYEKQWKNWLKNTGPWCVSRQIWWGHQIPAYHCTNTNSGESLWVSAHNYSDALKQAMEKFSVTNESCVNVVQDPDVLDTWFSSALHPFASLGWPNETEDFKKYYPLSLMETGNDLIFFWVARMVMLGMKLTGQVPFHNVLFHPLVRDKFNRKMSKSVGNVIDPIHVIDGVTMSDRLNDLKNNMPVSETKSTMKTVRDMSRENNGDIPVCGSDALRLSLLSHSLDVQSMRYDINEAILARKFCNKVWNNFKFLFQYISDDPRFIAKVKESRSATPLHTIEAWIRARLFVAASTCNDSMKKYRLADALNSVKKFHYEISDVYLRYCFLALSNVGDASGQAARVNDEFLQDDSKMAIVARMIEIMEVSLRLLSPFAPFLSEELWQRLPKYLLEGDVPKSVCLAAFPDCDNIGFEYDKEVEYQVECMLKVLSRVRLDRTRFMLPRQANVVCVCKHERTHRALTPLADVFPIFMNGDIEIHPFEDLDQLKRTCVGCALEEDDYFILFKFEAPVFFSYLRDKDVENQFETIRSKSMKIVEKLESKARNDGENLKDICDQILDECDKYRKYEAFSQSLQIVKANMKS